MRRNAKFDLKSVTGLASAGVSEVPFTVPKSTSIAELRAELAPLLKLENDSKLAGTVVNGKTVDDESKALSDFAEDGETNVEFCFDTEAKA